MSIIVLILKIIGIILLVLLGLLLLLTAIVLFVPIRYRVGGTADITVGTEEDKRAVFVKGKLSWLLHLVSVRLVLEGTEFSYKIRILGIHLQLNKDSTKKKKDKIKTRSRAKEKKITESKNIEESGKIKESKNIKESGKIKESKEIENVEITRITAQEIPKQREELVNSQKDSLKQRQDNSQAEERKTSIWQKMKAVFQKIKGIPGMIREKVEMLKEKLQKIKNVIKQVVQEIRDEQNRVAIKLVLSELKRLLLHIAPRRVRADIRFGMDDPSTTGQILGGISVLPFVYRYKLKLQPDFSTEYTYFNGNFDLKGHIRGIHMVVLAIHLFKDKNVQHIIARYRNM